MGMVEVKSTVPIHPGFFLENRFFCNGQEHVAI
jgi:hypothetical protein